jgi:hypothetical protein
VKIPVSPLVQTQGHFNSLSRRHFFLPSGGGGRSSPDGSGGEKEEEDVRGSVGGENGKKRKGKV